MADMWSCNNKLEVRKCSYKCEKVHEHFVGTYEKALNYYNVDEYDADAGYKNLKDIAIFHQLSDRTLTKTSAELYSIMMNACAKKDYWVPEDARHNFVMEALEECRNSYLIKDDDILKNARKGESNKRTMKRLYRQEKWEEMTSYD